MRGGDAAAGVVADIIDHFGLRAVDTASDSGIFSREGALGNLRKWRDYRDQVIS